MPADSPPPESFSLQFRLAGRPQRWLFHLRPTAVSLTIDTVTIYTFDREGRLFSTFQDGVNYRRSLGGQFLARSGEGAGDRRSRRRQLLNAAAAQHLIDRLQDHLVDVSRAQGAGAIEVDDAEGASGTEDGPDAMAPWIERLRTWDAAALTADAQRFAGVYRPVSILPPDRYMALVLQVTEGCPWNRCTFCDLYRDRPYRIRDAVELDDHLRQVRGYLGEGLRLRRSAFLADGNLLSVPGDQLRRLVDHVRTAFPEERFADLYAFCDVFGSRRLTRAELGDLAAAGVRRLYVGLETGCDALRRQLHKPGTAAQVVDGVARLSDAGIQVGVIVLLGPGGAEWSAAHERETAAVLEQMSLGKGDFVYFSPLVLPADVGPESSGGAESSGGPGRRLACTGRTPLAEDEMAAQRQRLEAATTCRERGAHLALYDIRDFAY